MFVFGLKVCQLLVGGSVGGDGVVTNVGCGGGMYGVDMCDLFPATARGATSLSFTINHASKKS